MGPLGGDSRFNMEACMVEKSAKSISAWLVKCLVKDGLLQRSWRCIMSLDLVLMKGFSGSGKLEC